MALFKLSEEKVNESIETGAYNIAASGVFGTHVLNAKRWGWAIQAPLNPLGALINGFASMFGIRDKLDQAYFKHYYRIDSKVESQLKPLIKEIGDVALFSSKEKYHVKGKTGGIHGSTKFDMEEENVEDRNAMNMKRKANEINPGTATAYHIVRFGDKYAIVFFVFDSNRIKEAKVATAKNEKSRSYSCVTIPGFNKIKPSEYTK